MQRDILQHISPAKVLQVREKQRDSSRLKETRKVWQSNTTYDARLNPGPTSDIAGQRTTTQRVSKNQMAGVYRGYFLNLDVYIVITKENAIV